MVAADVEGSGGQSPRIALDYSIGGGYLHAKALMLAQAQVRLRYPDVWCEPRNLSRFQTAPGMEIDYPAQASLVFDFLAAREQSRAVVNVWDVWPATASVAPPDILDLVSSQVAALAREPGGTRVMVGDSPDPGAWYFPASSVIGGAHWLSVFGSEDWEQFGPPDRESFGDCCGIIFYQVAIDHDPAPFTVDNPFPAPIQVSALGVYPPAPS